MAEPKKPVMVELESKDRKKNVKQKFPIDQANEILNLANTQWKLSDPKFQHNGKEIAKKRS